VARALFITTTLFFFINRIEGYSQRAAIDLLRSSDKANVAT
jgi:hypothetical protein